MNQQWNNLFYARKTPWNMLNQDETWSWNTLNQDETVFRGHETHCFMPMKHLESGTVTIEISILYIDFWFMVFHGVSRRCFMLFHCCSIAVSLLFNCCIMLFQGVSPLCFILFHGVSSLCFMVFQGVSLPCFILFHDRETGAVGTSLNSNPRLQSHLLIGCTLIILYRLCKFMRRSYTPVRREG